LRIDQERHLIMDLQARKPMGENVFFCIGVGGSLIALAHT
jgi:hypothetical protein